MTKIKIILKTCAIVKYETKLMQLPAKSKSSRTFDNRQIDTGRVQCKSFANSDGDQIPFKWSIHHISSSYGLKFAGSNLEYGIPCDRKYSFPAPAKPPSTTPIGKQYLEQIRGIKRELKMQEKSCCYDFHKPDPHLGNDKTTSFMILSHRSKTDWIVSTFLL